MDVSRPETKLTRAGFQNNLVLSVDSSKLLGNFLGSIRTGIVDNDNFPVDSGRFKRFSQKPNNYRKVLSLVICR